MKTKWILPSALALGLVFASCSSSSDKGGEAGSAADLMAQAKAAVDAQHADEAIALLDSLTKTFPGEIDLVKEAMLLKPQAVEIQSQQAVTRCDSLIEDAKRQIDNLRRSMRYVKEPRMIDGFWVDSRVYNPRFMDGTGIQARVTDIGQFYIVSSANPGIGHTSVSLSDGSSSVSTGTVPYDGESNYRHGGGEIISFTPEQSDTLGYFAAQGPGRPMTLLMNGRGSKSIRLSAAQTEAIANAYALAKAMEQGRNNEVEKQKQQRRIELARSQRQRLAAGQVKATMPVDSVR
ncbi:MAG: hypothetical protein ACI30D_04130 [Muribaculaceae bacterium]|nr:hypothetical protein [Muribaculaceae bacterium]